MLLYAGVPILLVNFAAPYQGLIGLPITFFLKNRLHLSAHRTAQFNLIVGNLHHGSTVELGSGNKELRPCATSPSPSPLSLRASPPRRPSPRPSRS
jgi:hypothetical protein